MRAWVQRVDVDGKWHVEIRILFRLLWCFALTLFLWSLFASGKIIYVFVLKADSIGDKWLKNNEMDFKTSCEFENWKCLYFLSFLFIILFMIHLN